jgi:hypothetical protein
MLKMKDIYDVKMPEIGYMDGINHSGNMHLAVLLRNMGADLSENIRGRAAASSRNNVPLEILEVTHGFPLALLEFLDPSHFRHHGDMLLYHNGSGHDAPGTRCTVVCKEDKFRSWLQGDFDFENEHDNWFFTKDTAGSALGVNAYERDGVKDRMLEAYDSMVEAGRLRVLEGDVVESLEKLDKEIDLAFSNYLGWEIDRPGHIQALQGALKPGADAFIPIKWWRPKSLGGMGVEHIVYLNDLVDIGNDLIPLEDYFVNGSECYDTVQHSGIKLLIPTGTFKPQPVREMTAEQYKSDVPIERDLPSLVWTPGKERPVKKYDEKSLLDRLLGR